MEIRCRKVLSRRRSYRSVHVKPARFHAVRFRVRGEVQQIRRTLKPQVRAFRSLAPTGSGSADVEGVGTWRRGSRPLGGTEFRLPAAGPEVRREASRLPRRARGPPHPPMLRMGPALSPFGERDRSAIRSKRDRNPYETARSYSAGRRAEPAPLHKSGGLLVPPTRPTRPSQEGYWPTHFATKA